MPLLTILTPSEKISFDSPPLFTGVERKKYFRFPTGIMDVVNTLQTPTTQICFLLLFGYFKATNKFFNKGFVDEDVVFVAKQLEVEFSSVDVTAYSRQRFAAHKTMILHHLGWSAFDSHGKDLLKREVGILVRSQIRPKAILKRIVELLISRKVEIPSYHLLAATISQEMQKHQRELGKTIQQGLNKETKLLLDELVGKDEEKVKRYRLTLLKRFSQSTRPAKIKENIADLLVLRELFVAIESTLNTLNLTRDGIRYYAYCVLKFDMPQVLRRNEAERYLYLTAFIAHQYYTLQDLLVDVLLQATQSVSNTAKKNQTNRYVAAKPERLNAVTEIAEVFEESEHRWQTVKRIVLSESLTSDQKLEKLLGLINQEGTSEPERARETLDALKKDTKRMMMDTDYYDIWEGQSIWLQNRTAEIIKHVIFNKDTSQKGLIQTIDHFLSKDGKVTNSAPTGFLAEKEKGLVLDSHKRLRISLYKSLLFKHTATAIKAGKLNLKYSYRYRSIEDILINATRWQENKKALLEQAGLTKFARYETVKTGLETELNTQYETTNRNIMEGRNPHITLRKNGDFTLNTPRREDFDAEVVTDLFPKPRSIPLLEVLTAVNQATGFLDALTHLQNTHIKEQPKNKTLFAGIIGMGCNIGIQQIARISKDISVRELEHTVNWCFSVDNLMSANDHILSFLNKLDLPKFFKKEQTKTRTSSDGSKYVSGVDSLNANNSYKHPGSDKSLNVISFIDESSRLPYSTVVSPSDREAIYVIDGLLHNDVVKSDMHSTDTHGYTELVFATTYLLGFFFAPRIKHLSKQQRYSFVRRKVYAARGFPILPHKTIMSDPTPEEWDQILRFITTLKLREATASQLFQRLSSYSTQHPLYRALKKFGQIPKTIFILKNIDDVEMRQDIEKQLNLGENANKLGRAVFYGNNQEFQQETKEEQLIAETNKRLIENSIICWNYLHVSERIATTPEEKRPELLNQIKNSSMVIWQHVNLHGEFDFSDEKLKDAAVFNLSKILELKVV